MIIRGQNILEVNKYTVQIAKHAQEQVHDPISAAAPQEKPIETVSGPDKPPVGDLVPSTDQTDENGQHIITITKYDVVKSKKED